MNTKHIDDGDPEVVQLTELYQGACRALDEAGVPYAIDVEIPPHIVIEATIGELAPHKEIEIQQVPAHPGSLQLGLPDRIRWLASERPIRAELESAHATRKLAEEMATKYMAERDEARARVGEVDASAMEEIARLVAERDQLQRMYEGASDDLDRERREHQEAEAFRAAEVVKLMNAGEALKAAVVERNTTIRALIESELPAGDLRLALAGMIGFDDWKLHLVDLDRHAQQRKIADQAGYIEQLEVEIEALEDQIDRLDSNPDLPDMWTGCKVGAP